MFSLKNFEPTYKSTWDAIVKNSKNGNFLYTRDYIDYHANRFNEKSVILERKEMPVVVFPATSKVIRSSAMEALPTVAWSKGVICAQPKY